MKRILFVDDEPKVLQGLRRMLRSLRREWDMEFAESGADALEMLAAGPFDVVVTDMRMPGMDGAQLLTEVARLHPDTVRIILSGQCDREAVLKCVGPAHQFLTKPCESELLKQTVARACHLRDQLTEDWRQRLISQVQSVPSLPSLHTALVAELAKSKPSIQNVAKIVSQDVGMTAKAVQLVSSSFFGSPQRVSRADQAIDLLGMDTLKPLVSATDAFKPMNVDETEAHSLVRLVQHSRLVGATARAIAEEACDDSLVIGDAYLAGFLHDVGIVALAQPFSVDGKQLPMWEAERMSLSQTHAEAGAYLMALWGLPDPVVKAIAYHHSPGHSSEESFTALTAVHVANALLEEDVLNSIGTDTPLDARYLDRIGCLPHLDAWREISRSMQPEGVEA